MYCQSLVLGCIALTLNKKSRMKSGAPKNDAQCFDVLEGVRDRKEGEGEGRLSHLDTSSTKVGLNFMIRLCLILNCPLLEDNMHC